MTNKAKPEKDAKGRFLSWNIGGGRKLGSRNKLDQEFVDALEAEFSEHGAAAIRLVRETDPVAFVRVIASVLPKEHRDVTEKPLTDAELEQRIRELLAITGLDRASGPPVGLPQSNGSAKPH